MPPDVLAGARRILAIRLDNIGDVLLLGPALRALRDAAEPAASVTLLASRAGRQAVPLLPWIDVVVVERAVWQDASAALPLDPNRERELIGRLADARFDVAFVFTSFSQTPWAPAYACYLAGIPIRIGQAVDFGGSLLTHAVAAAPVDGHQAERNLHLLDAVGIPVADRDLAVAIPVAARTNAHALLVEAGIDPDEPFILAAPGASCPARRPSPAGVAAALRHVHAETGLPVVVAGATTEHDLLAPLTRPASGFHSVVGQTDVPTLAALIEGAAVLVCANSAPLHLADALGTPLVVLYAGTDLETQWRPRRAPSVLLRRETACAPCYRFECPYAGACLDVAPAAIAGAVLDTLSAAGSRPSHAQEVACVPSAS
jgi:ADP-heptose:LPS heptosyltransferase